MARYLQYTLYCPAVAVDSHTALMREMAAGIKYDCLIASPRNMPRNSPPRAPLPPRLPAHASARTAFLPPESPERMQLLLLRLHGLGI